MDELAYFRYFEYGLFDQKASSVLIDWRYSPEPKLVCSYLPIIDAFMSWVTATYANTDYSFEKYKHFEWVLRFPYDNKNANLILFKMRWSESLNAKNSGISS